MWTTVIFWLYIQRYDSIIFCSLIGTRIFEKVQVQSAPWYKNKFPITHGSYLTNYFGEKFPYNFEFCAIQNPDVNGTTFEVIVDYKITNINIILRPSKMCSHQSTR